MTVIPFTGLSWEANSYLVVSGTHAVLIDAGVSADVVKEELSRRGATLDAVLLTHGHFDHTISADKLRESFSVPVMIHEADAEMLMDAEKSALYYFFGTRSAHLPADRVLKEGDTIPLGDTVITVHHTPGHSLGSVCYRVEDALFTGDTIFSAGYGRCDLYGGDMHALAGSLASLRALKQDLTIYPGHGGASTLGAALDNLFGLT